MNTFIDALNKVIADTEVHRYRYLCLEHPNPVVRSQYQQFVIESSGMEVTGDMPAYSPVEPDIPRFAIKEKNGSLKIPDGGLTWKQRLDLISRYKRCPNFTPDKHISCQCTGTCRLQLGRGINPKNVGITDCMECLKENPEFVP